jgi:hypothetical protein
LRLAGTLKHYQRVEPRIGGDACQEYRSVFIDPAQLIGTVLFCADASFRADPAPSTAPINAFEISG